MCQRAWVAFLELRRNYACVLLLYTIFNNFTPIKFSDYFQLNELTTRSHLLTIYPISSSINSYRYSFFVNTIFLWNSITCVLSAPWPFLNINLYNFCFDYNIVCFVSVHILFCLLYFACVYM